MHIALWVAQGILAAMFTMAGLMKTMQPVEKLKQSGMNWVERFPVSTVRLIGLSQIAAAAGLILPWLLNILPVLTPIAATGLALTMFLAALHHIKHKEYKGIGVNTGLFLLAAFVAWGRFCL